MAQLQLADRKNPRSLPTGRPRRLGSAELYNLDVATDDEFLNMVDGYNNLDVGNVTEFTATGLEMNTIYYYRVRIVPTITTNNIAYF